jgi:ABC-type uncharacterized transport system auxiliary subunit
MINTSKRLLFLLSLSLILSSCSNSVENKETIKELEATKTKTMSSAVNMQILYLLNKFYYQYASFLG